MAIHIWFHKRESQKWGHLGSFGVIWNNKGRKWTKSRYDVIITWLIYLNRAHLPNSLSPTLWAYFWPRLTYNRVVKKQKIKKQVNLHTIGTEFMTDLIDSEFAIFKVTSRVKLGSKYWSVLTITSTMSFIVDRIKKMISNFSKGLHLGIELLCQSWPLADFQIKVWSFSFINNCVYLYGKKLLFHKNPVYLSHTIYSVQSEIQLYTGMSL